MFKNRGLTLVELLVGLMIISLLFAFCLPLKFSLYGNNQLKVLENEISTAIRFSRNMALTQQLPLILTPLPNSQDWSEGMILFRDNQNHQYTKKDKIIHQWNWLKQGVQVSWQGFHSKSYLLFASELSHSAMSGHFTIQDREGKTVKLVINRLGRIVSRI